VYVLECADGSLYTGVTNDLERRLEAHARGRGAKYTRGRLPVRLVALPFVGSKGEALSEEHAIKRLSRSAKLSRFATART
jgi:putative endonuclease